MRRLALLAVAGLLTIASGWAGTVAADAGPSRADGFCDDPEQVPFQGLSCPAEHGWKVRLEDGTVLRTHGPDPEASGSGTGSSATGQLDGNPDAPVCASGAGEYRNVLVYAHPQDVDSRYGEVKDDLRRLVAEINGFLEEEARQEGYVAEYRFLCNDDGQVRVLEETLPHDNSQASFGTVVHDLRDRGYDDHNEKYWIFYDDQDGVVPWGGQANVYDDGSDSVDNRNNRGPSYAITWGELSSQTMMHEAAHTMGAVQEGAPHFYDNYGGWHCYDEADVMCYGQDARRTDGPGSTTVYCPARIAFDCGKDDYFDPSPAAGSYLDTHWNMGSGLNRFIERAACDSYRSSREVAAATTGGGEPAGPGPSRDAYSCGDPLDAAVGRDAEGHRVAASPTGDATGAVAVSGTGASRGAVAVSGLGSADGTYVGASGAGTGTGLVAASGTDRAESGESTCPAGAICYIGGVAAASGTGPAEGGIASASGTDSADGTVAASGTDQATGVVAVSGANDCGKRQCVDASPRGEATAATLAVSGTGESEAGVAVSGTGTARGVVAVSGVGSARSCYGPNDGAWYLGCVAVSGTGESEADILSVSGTDEARGGVAVVSGTGDATSECAAVSGTGSAEAPGGFCSAGGRPLEASGCETVHREVGTRLACANPDPLLP